MSTYKIQFENRPVAAIQTLAELFVTTREEKKITIEEIAIELQISPLYLESLESGTYGNLPCLVYSRNFVKCYARRLGLPLNAVMELFGQEWELFSKHQQQLLDLGQEKGVSKRDLWRMPRWIRWMGASLVVVSMMVYLGTELYALRQPPELTIYTPEEEVVTEKQIIEIAGITEPEVALSINDQTILSDTNGNFNEMVALQPGLNIVEITAKKKYSQEHTVFRRILVEDQPVITEAGSEMDHRS